MAEYIEREALKEHLMSYAGMFTDELGFVVSLQAVLNGIDFQPAADVAEVKHGRWKYYKKQGIAVCTNCSFERNVDDNFGRAVACPNCGARMDGEDDG